MEYLLTAKEMQYYDRTTIDAIGIPASVLMERAALGVCEEILKFHKETGKKSCSVLILCGCGNNGADGLALARLLSGHMKVEAVTAGDPEKDTELWKMQAEILTHYPVKTGSKPLADEYDILVDALFGVGLSREIGGDYADLIRWFNERNGFKIAVDVPSGINSDSGKVMGCAAKCDLTVSFAFGKRGLYFYPGCQFAGKVVVKDIGIGENAFGTQMPGMFRYCNELTALLPERAADGNKGTFGKVLIAAGSKNMAGAAVLAAEACYRTGAGMVKVLTPDCNREILQRSVPEALLCTDAGGQPDHWPDVLAAGPGLGTDSWGYEILRSFLENSSLPLVIDADGLNLLALHRELMDLLASQCRDGRKVILTPHVGEIARLCGCTVDAVKEYPVDTAIGLAQKLNCVIVNKDARTLTCQADKPVCLNTTGNSGMAVAGSGDVLTGIIAGLLAQGAAPFSAASVGVYLHGHAGDAAAKAFGERSMTASDIISKVSEVIKKGGICHDGK